MESKRIEHPYRIEHRNDQGELHREDGPAVEYSNGYKWYYLNNILYTEEQFHQEVIKLKLNRLINH